MRLKIDVTNYLYAYRLNYVVIRNQRLNAFNRQKPCPLPPLDPSKPPKVEVVVVSYKLMVTFGMKKGGEASTFKIN